MTGVLSLLEVPHEPKVLLLEADPGSAGESASGWAASGLVVRTVRGRKMRTYQGVFDEFAAALQFPLYFGDNMDAFDECIADLAWLPAQSGYVILVTDPQEVLADEGDDGIAWLVGSLVSASVEWSRPVDLGEWWDRPAVPFHVVLQFLAVDRVHVVDRWRSAGAVLEPLPGSVVN